MKLPLCAQQVSNLQYEMLLLTDSISKEGGCWELRLRCGKSDFLNPPAPTVHQCCASQITLYIKLPSYAQILVICYHVFR